MYNSKKKKILCHIAISGNDKADTAAKSALKMALNNFKILYTDLKTKINMLFYKNGNKIGGTTYITNSLQ